MVLTMAPKHRTWQHNAECDELLVDERDDPGPDGTTDIIAIVYGQQ